MPVAAIARRVTAAGYFEREDIEMTLTELGIITGKKLIVKTNVYSDFVVHLGGVEILEGKISRGCYGAGDTEAKGRRDYAEKLCGARIVVDAYACEDIRREFQLPPVITGN